MLTPDLVETILLTLRLAAVTTLILLALGAPLAWWLATGRSALRDAVGAVVSLPIVLPPTVLGFYLLLALGPRSPLADLTGGPLAFSFEGLVAGSVLYSMPFAIGPIRTAFEAMGPRPMEAAATLRASPLDAFVSVALPLAAPGILTGAILSFAHTIGEFGVVLMIGGAVPGETKVLSIAIFDLVETLEWETAHALSAGMLVLSFAVILSMVWIERRLTGARR